MARFNGDEAEQLQELARDFQIKAGLMRENMWALRRLPAPKKFQGLTATQISEQWQNTLGDYRRLRQQFLDHQVTCQRLANQVQGQINEIISARNACAQAQMAAEAAGAAPGELAQIYPAHLSSLDLEWTTHARSQDIRFAQYV